MDQIKHCSQHQEQKEVQKSVQNFSNINDLSKCETKYYRSFLKFT